MAYIIPAGEIQLFKGCDLDPNYNHTFRFNTIEDQNNYFENTLTPLKFTNQNYVNFSENTIRLGKSDSVLLPLITDSYMTVNYMRFKNNRIFTDNRDRWYYAFVTSARRINNNCIELTYQLDVMQTWHFDYTVAACYVEREHTASDELFEHTIPEPVGSGEFVCEDTDEITEDQKQYLHILYYPNDAQGVFYGRTFSGLSVHTIELSDYGIGGDRVVINQFINEVIKASGTIVAMFQTPFTISQTDGGAIGYEEKGIQCWFGRGGFNPRNNKLYSSQFNVICATNHNGQIKTYKPELFYKNLGVEIVELDPNMQNGKYLVGFKFHAYFLPAPSPTYTLVPDYYNGFGCAKYGEFSYNSQSLDNSITLTNFPVCSWTSDAFQSWWSQNKNTYMTGLVVDGIQVGLSAGSLGQSIGMTAASIMSGNVGGIVSGAKGIVGGMSGVVQSAGNVAKDIALYGDMKAKPDNLGGLAQNSNLGAILLSCDINLRWMHIKNEYAKTVDQFFDMFGYQVNSVKVPNVITGYGRPTWNYVKTKGCIIHLNGGGIPAEDEALICSVYDKGVTFWMYGGRWNNARIGSYHLDNYPIDFSINAEGVNNE